MLLIDSGPLYASIDRDDAHHEECADLLAGHPGPLLVPSLVLTEVAYLVGARLGSGPEVRLLQDFAEGNLVFESVEPRDWLRIAELVHRYRDLPLGTVDASLVAAAERLGAEEVASLDRRHLGAVRPRHVERLRLLP
ncbi:MAG TPA: PIN domain-containing protein [Planctomycetota bacterium]|nr:PIN domain-containing protein [Planctomycetota bacterium]